MAVELFLVPMVGDGTEENSYRGAYTDDAQVSRSGTLRYGRTNSAAIVMIDAPQAYLDSVAAQPDATRLATAQNIDQPLTAGQADAAKTVFESMFIPAQFINAGDTRRQVLRTVIGMFLFSQRMEGRFGTGWKARAQAAGVTLDTQWADFPQALKDEFIEIRGTFGWNVTLPTPPTLRNIMKTVSDKFASTPFYICGVTI